MKTISIILYDITLIGGAEKVAINLANEFSNVYKVNLISVFKTNDHPIENVNKSINLIYLDHQPKSLTVNLFKYAISLNKILKEQDNNILITITAGLNSIAKLASLRTDTKLIYTEHSNLKNSEYGLKHKTRQWIGSMFFDQVVVLTNEDKIEFINKYKINKSKIRVIYNWIPEFSIKNVRYNSNSKTIVSVGRLTKVKSFDRAIRVAKEVFQLHPDWKWEVYGDGDEFKRLNKLVIDSGLENHFFLKGFSKNIEKVLSSKSMFVSTSSFEGLPLSFLEAKMFKLPIISFDCPTGPREIINDNQDGYLIKPYKEDVMAEKIISLIEDKEKREYFSHHSSDNLRLFSKEVILNKWLQLIEEV